MWCRARECLFSIFIQRGSSHAINMCDESVSLLCIRSSVRASLTHNIWNERNSRKAIQRSRTKETRDDVNASRIDRQTQSARLHHFMRFGTAEPSRSNPPPSTCTRKHYPSRIAGTRRQKCTVHFPLIRFLPVGLSRAGPWLDSWKMMPKCIFMGKWWKIMWTTTVRHLRGDTLAIVDDDDFIPLLPSKKINGLKIFTTQVSFFSSIPSTSFQAVHSPPSSLHTRRLDVVYNQRRH